VKAFLLFSGYDVHTALRLWRVFALILAFLSVFPGMLLGQPVQVLEKEDLTVLYEEPLKGGAEEVVELYGGVKQDVEERIRLEVTFIPSILLIKNTGTFRKMAGGDLVVAFAVPEENLMVIDYSKMKVSPFSLVVTVKHELCHLVVHHYLGGRRIPKWLDEGLAQWASEGIGEIITEHKKSSLNEAVLAGRIIPMRAISDFFPGDRESLTLAYDQSESLVTYMIDRYGLEGILDILKSVKEGETWDDAVRSALGVSFLDLEDGWHHYLKKRLTWFTYMVNNLYEILFFFAALASVIGFVRAYLRKRAYMREQEAGEQ
jgi:hypothetical protein